MTIAQALNKIYEEMAGGMTAPHSGTSALDAVNDIIKLNNGDPVTELGDGIYTIASRNRRVSLSGGTLDTLAEQFDQALEAAGVTYDDFISMLNNHIAFCVLTIDLEDNLIGHFNGSVYLGAPGSEYILRGSVVDISWVGELTATATIALGRLEDIDDSSVCTAFLNFQAADFAPINLFDPNHYMADHTYYTLEVYTIV